MQRKILVVDDSKFTRTIVKMPLSKAGYDVTTLGDPGGAFDYIAREKPDLVISDLKMPTLNDGVNFLRRLGQIASTTPVLVYTAEPNAADEVGDTGLAHIRFIKKPIAPDDLQDKIKELLE